MALSKKFSWVRINRDRTPEIPKRFRVTAYPTLLLLGDKDEKIHRFSGFKKPEEFVAQLQEALQRLALYRAGRKWDDPNPRPDTLCDEGTLESFPAPSEEVPSGLAYLGGLWVAQGKVLQRLDKRGEVTAKFAGPAGVNAWCTDGKVLYGCSYGWTAGRPIYVVDSDGKTVREIVTEANRPNRAMSAAGIAFRDGKLHVLSGMRGQIFQVDPATGKVEKTLQTDQRWLYGLCFDGTHFVAAGRKAICWIDPETGKTARKIPLHYPVRCVTFHEGAYYLMEQPVFGNDRDHKRIRVWPKRTKVYKLKP